MSDRDDCQYDLFVASARADESWVKGCLLPALGLPREKVIAQADFHAGMPLVSEYERAVRSSRHTILVLSPAFLADNWAALGEGFVSYLGVREQKQRLIPLRLEPCELPLRLDFLVSLDCTDEANWQNEFDRLRDLLGAAVPPPAAIPCPYPGMVPFQEGDARFFCGREAEISDLLNRLRHQHFVLVVGPSGSGKSSLITAGLRPRLPQASYFSPNYWRVIAMRPGAQPCQNLARTLGCDDDVTPAAVDALLAGDPPAEKLLLIVDQLEEVFSQGEPAAQRRFLRLLKQLRGFERCAVIVAMRADFYDDLMQSELSPIDASQRLEVFPLKDEALRQAIERPARAAGEGVYVEGRLVDALLADAAEERGALPMLQEALVQIWEQRLFRLLPYVAYEKLGAGARCGLAAAMTAKADATLAGFSAAQQAIARRIFLRLVQFGEGRVDTRRQQPVSALRSAADDPADFEHTLRALVDNRLLTLDADHDEQVGPRVDIAHEALFAGWPRLSRWIAERRDAELTRRRLEALAVEWDRLGRKTGGLLDTVELAEARQWLDGLDAVHLGYSDALAALVAASKAACDAAEEEKRRRQAREVDDARRLEAARQQRTKILIALAGVVAAGILITILIISRWTEDRAELVRSNSQGESLRLTAAAQERLVTDPVRSLVDAAAALPQGPGDKRPYLSLPEFVLRQALQRSLERAYVALPVRLPRDQGIDLDGPAIAVAAGSPHVIGRDLAPGTQITLTGHTSPARGVAWAADQSLVSFDRQSVLAWQGNVRIANRAFAPETVQAVAPRPGSREVAVCTASALWLWDYGGSDRLRRMEGHTGCSGINARASMQWSGDGRRLAAWDQQRALFLFDAQTGDTARLAGLDGDHWFLALGWSPFGERLVALANDVKVRVWDSPAARPEPLVFGASDNLDQQNVVAGLIFVDADRFITWGWDDAARMWSVEGQPAGIFAPGAGRMHGIKLSPDRETLLTFMDAAFYEWSLDAGRPTAFMGHANPVLDADWDGDYLATAAADGTARVWSRGTGKNLLTFYASAISGVIQRADVVAVRWTGDRLLTVGDDGTLRLWQVFDNRNAPLCDGADVGGQPLCFGNSLRMAGGDLALDEAHWLGAHTVAGTGLDGAVSRWDLGEDALVSLPATPDNVPRSVVYSPDHKQAFFYPPLSPAADPSGGEVWSLESLALIAPVRGPLTAAWWVDGGLLLADATLPLRLVDPKTGAGRDLPGSRPDVADAASHGDRLAIAYNDGSVEIRNALTGEVLAQPGQGQTEMINEVVWRGDGKTLLTAGTAVYVWDAATGKLIVKLDDSEGLPGRPVFSPGNEPKYIAGGVGDTLFVWDAQTGRAVWRETEPGSTVTSVEWTTGAGWGGASRTLLVAASGNTAHIWDWQGAGSFEIMRVLDTMPIREVAVNPDGEWVLTTSEGGTVRAWRAWLNRPDSLLEAARTANTRPMEPGPTSE